MNGLQTSDKMCLCCSLQARNGCSLLQGLRQLLNHRHTSLFGSNTAKDQSRCLKCSDFETIIDKSVKCEKSSHLREVRLGSEGRTEQRNSAPSTPKVLWDKL